MVKIDPICYTGSANKHRGLPVDGYSLRRLKKRLDESGEKLKEMNVGVFFNDTLYRYSESVFFFKEGLCDNRMSVDVEIFPPQSSENHSELVKLLNEFGLPIKNGNGSKS